jgi:hypothetical protein
MDNGGMLPLLMAVPLAATTAWAGISAAKMSRNPKTAAGDEAAEQAKADREARHQAVRGGTQ